MAETPGVAVRRASYVITGAGLVAAGAALGVYLWNRGRYDDWQSTNTALQTAPSGTPSYHQRAVANNQLADSLTTANHEILALSIAAGALVATGVTLYLVDRAHRRRSGELAIGWGRTGPAGSSASLCWSLTW